MDTRKTLRQGLLFAAVAGLVAGGSIAKADETHPDEGTAAAAPKDAKAKKAKAGKNGCAGKEAKGKKEGKSGCGANGCESK